MIAPLIVLAAVSLAQAAASPNQLQPPPPDVQPPSAPQLSPLPTPFPAPRTNPDPACVDHLGREGQLFILGDAAFSVGGEHDSAGLLSEDIFRFIFGLNMGYFVSAYFAPGGFFAVNVATGGGATKTTLEIGPSLTLRAPVTEKVSFLPSFAVGYEMVYTSTQNSTGVTANGAVINLSLPFAFELGTGVALAVGPQVAVSPLSASNGTASESVTVLTYSLQVGLIGWI